MSTDKRKCNIKIDYYGSTLNVNYTEIELFIDTSEEVEYWISCNISYTDKEPIYIFRLASWSVHDIEIDDLTLLNEEQLFQYFTFNSNPKVNDYELDIYLIYEIQKYIKKFLPIKMANTEEIITIEY